jgi:hypothetical protein
MAEKSVIYSTLGQIGPLAADSPIKMATIPASLLAIVS